MDNLTFLKGSLWLVLITAILGTIALIVYELTKAGKGLSDSFRDAMDNMFGPSKVVTPQGVQHFLDEPSNQLGGYTPWVPQQEEDESYPPTWLGKGE